MHALRSVVSSSNWFHLYTKLHLLLYMYFCIIYIYLYNLQLCLTCMEMKLMDNKILLNLESWIQLRSIVHSKVLNQQWSFLFVCLFVFILFICVTFALKGFQVKIITDYRNYWQNYHLFMNCLKSNMLRKIKSLTAVRTCRPKHRTEGVRN